MRRRGDFDLVCSETDWHRGIPQPRHRWRVLFDRDGRLLVCALVDTETSRTVAEIDEVGDGRILRAMRSAEGRLGIRRSSMVVLVEG